MPKGIFVTATGTDVGKTVISSLIVKKLAHAGINIGYYKAALSGAEQRGGERIAGDAHYVYKTAGLTGNPNDAVSYIFTPSVSPHLAARMVNIRIDMKKIQKDFDAKLKEHAFLLMEGSGGIICPISAQTNNPIFLTDIIKALHLSIIIVADAGLGTINSTMLTVYYAKSQGIHIQAILLNRYDPQNAIHMDNKKMISAMSGIPIYTCDSHCTDLDIPVNELQNLFQDVDSSRT